MPIKIISVVPPKNIAKQCVCKNCGATLEYTPNDVSYKTYKDYSDGSDVYVEFNCPNCGKLIQFLKY